MRNDIQYRQAEGVWYPYYGKVKTSSIQQEVVAILSEQTKLSTHMSITGSDLVQFRAACCAIICFARNVIADMSTVGGARHTMQTSARSAIPADPCAAAAT